MGKLVENLWDCPYCGTKGILGRNRDCPNCGKPRGEETKFYLPDTISYVSDELAKKINRNADWYCPYCDSLNPASTNTCKSCGSIRTSENLDYFSIRSKTTNSTSQKTHETNEISNVSKRNLSFKPIKAKNWIYFLVLLAIVSLVYIFIPKNENITITGFKWNRTIEIERYQTVDESDWSLPPNSILKYTKQEIYTYEQVLDHYETRTRTVPEQRIVGFEEYVLGYRDLGNGYSEEITGQRPVYETVYVQETYQEPIYLSKPIYMTKYYYETHKWLYDRQLTSSGNNQEPYWNDSSTLSSTERVSTRKESYYIIGINKKGAQKKVSVSYDDWINFVIGQQVKLKFSIFGNGELIK